MEAQIMIDRDELAARCLVARLSALNAADAYRADADAIAENAIDCTDALLARLRPEAVAPVAPASGVPATDPRRTVGAVVRDVLERDYVVVMPGEGQVQRRVDLDLNCDAPIYAAEQDTFVRWATPGECARHGIPYVERGAAPSPAATPAPYVPKVGDVVHGLYGDDTLARITYVALNGKTGRASGFGRNQIPDSFVAFTDDVRPATSSERAAAGLPVDAPAFDEAKEREAALDAYRAGTDGCIDPDGTKYPTCRDSFRNGWLARARVAAKGGA